MAALFLTFMMQQAQNYVLYIVSQEIQLLPIIAVM